MNITHVGIDLAKMVFQVHGIDARGKVGLRKQLRRSQVMAFFAQLPSCLIGMWLARVAARRNSNIAAVALANKNARIVWALLAHGRDYLTGYRSANAVAAA